MIVATIAFVALACSKKRRRSESRVMTDSAASSATPVGVHQIAIRDLTFRYVDTAVDVLRIDRLDVGAGEFVSLLGASGSGKSTLLRLLANLLTATSGSVQRSIEQADIGMVFQSPTLIPWKSAIENIRLPSQLGPTVAGASTDVKDLLQLVGLKQTDMGKRPAELSGGMQMRVAIARALILTPELLLLDEPFSALDDVLRMQLETDVRRIHLEQSLTSVLVTHNIAEAVFMSDRILILSDCRIAHDVQLNLPVQRNVDVRSTSEFHSAVDLVTGLLHAAAGK